MPLSKNENNRDLDVFTDQEKINYMLEKYLNEAVMYIQGFDPPYKVKIASYTAPDSLLVNLGEYRPETGQNIVLFRILGRYMHITCTVAQQMEDEELFLLKVQSAAIAKKNRSSLRIPVTKNDVFISNIRTSKHTIDATLYSIPTSVKVNFSSVELTLKAAADYVKIDVFKDRGSILYEIQQTGKPLLVKDCSDPASYEPIDDTYVDYAEFLDDEITKKIQEYRNNKIKSEAIVPIIYYTHDNSPISLGYIQMQSNSDPFDETKIEELKQTALQMVERIRDSNTVMIQERQSIVNLSRGGLKVMIDHEDLRMYLQRMKGFTFDLFFKGQSPVTLYGSIRAAYMSRDHCLILGIQISGTSSSKKDLKFFNDNLDLLENEYKIELEKKKSLGK